MSQPVAVADSLTLLSASVAPALEATSGVAAKVTAASSEYIAAKHRLDTILDEAAHVRGQKRAATHLILSKKRLLGVDIVESSHDSETIGVSSPEGLSISEVCDGVLQVSRCLARAFATHGHSFHPQARTVVKSEAIQQAARLIGYSVNRLDIGGVVCMELRFDSSAGGTFSDAKSVSWSALLLPVAA
jgi:hypothetical protein